MGLFPWSFGKELGRICEFSWDTVNTLSVCGGIFLQKTAVIGKPSQTSRAAWFCLGANVEHSALVKFILLFLFFPSMRWTLNRCGFGMEDSFMPVPLQKTPKQTAHLTVRHIKALGCILIYPMRAAVRSRILNRNQDIGTLLLCFCTIKDKMCIRYACTWHCTIFTYNS